MDPMHYMPAADLVQAVREREVSSRELTDLFIARIEKHDGRTNAIVARRFEAARKEADEADLARSRGRSLGPLHGLPVTVKESFDVAGLPTTWGHKGLANSVAKADALAVQRLRAAGAIVLGKTNVPRLLSDWQTFNDVYGVTSNPWALDRSPGGSSGGSAVAMAAGYSALELGSDIAGSLRNPAHYCGVWGHKPSFGVASPRGQAIQGSVAPTDMSAIGPMARSAGDLALALKVIAGPDAIEARAWKLELPQPKTTTLAGQRIGLVIDDAFCPVGSEIRAAFDELEHFLKEAGAIVTRTGWPATTPEELWEVFVTMLRATTSRNFADAELRQFRDELRTVPLDDKSYYTLLRRGALSSHRGWLVLNERRAKLRLALDEALRTGFDALITPVACTPAIPHDHSEPRHARTYVVDGDTRLSIDQLYWAALPTLAYLPATAIPIGQSDERLPVGAQIIGRQFDDFATIRLAELIERGFRRFVAPPGFH